MAVLCRSWFFLSVCYISVWDGILCSDAGETQPNIIYILADDLGYSDVGYTDGYKETPTLNRLAREGVILRQHYVQQVCTPTRGALMTGRYPIHTGLQHEVIFPGEPWGLPLHETTLPQILKEYNYTTHAVGKWHLGMHTWSYTPLHRGFDDFFGYYLGGENYTSHMHEDGIDLRSDYFDEEGRFVDQIRHDLDGRYSAELYSEHTMDLLTKLKTQPEQPFFIYLAFQNTHAPHMVPQRYIDKYTTHIRDEKEKVFSAMVSAMDEAIGNITDRLIETGLAENTIVVFSSDNGGNVNCIGHVVSSNYPYRGGKRSLYEGGVRSPSFVWSKGLLAPSISNAMIHVTDWLPTFWSLASMRGKLKPNNPIKTMPLDGVDQWLAISRDAPSNRTEFIINIDLLPVKCGHQVPHAGLRWGEWKLILGTGGPPSGWYPTPTLQSGCTDDGSYVELYNIEEDPSETRNVSHLYPELVRHLTTIIESYNRTAVPINNKSFDPASDPKNFNYTWMPWLSDSPTADVSQASRPYFLSKQDWLAGNDVTNDDILPEEACFEETLNF